MSTLKTARLSPCSTYMHREVQETDKICEPLKNKILYKVKQTFGHGHQDDGGVHLLIACLQCLRSDFTVNHWFHPSFPLCAQMFPSKKQV